MKNKKYLRLLVGICFIFIISMLISCGKQKDDAESSKAKVEVNSGEDLDVSEAKTYKFEIKEIWCKNNGKRIYGKAYVPEIKGKVPLVIYSHSINSTYSAGIDYAETIAARGVAVYTFDYIGGSTNNKSDGKSTDMSIMTEVSDLQSVIEEAKKWDFVDSKKIALLGAGQGGMVSAITAARHKDEIQGLMLMYPAFLSADTVHNKFVIKKNIPDTFDLIGLMDVGRKYAEDIWDYDVYDEIGNYDKNMLLLHGYKDTTVNISYSVKADEVYKNCEFHILMDAGHGFFGKNLDEASGYICNYLQEINFIKSN